MRTVDINTASLDELSLFRGIGKKRAERIIAGRPYEDAYQLVSRGVLGENTYEKNKCGLLVKAAVQDEHESVNSAGSRGNSVARSR